MIENITITLMIDGIAITREFPVALPTEDSGWYHRLIGMSPTLMRQIMTEIQALNEEN